MMKRRSWWLTPSLQQWNKIVLISCLTAVCIDPLLSYIPLVDADRFCINLDHTFAIIFCLLRTTLDVFYLSHTFLQFGFTTLAHSNSSGEADSRSIMKRSYLIMDLLSILPLPQVVTVIAIRDKINPVRIRPATILTVGQNLVRVVRIVPLLKKVTDASGISAAWAGAASNFLFYMLASHVIGSFWYLASVERVDRCWRLACAYNHHCSFDDLYCGRGPVQRDNSFLDASCSYHQPSEPVFDYGIFLSALKVQLYPDFFMRFFYSFVWGLRNLSSLGQNLETSSHIGENLFVVLISVTGLFLFSFLAANIQRYLQYFTGREDGMRMKLRDQELWMSRNIIPQDLRERIRRYEQYKWQQKREVDEESIIRNLPKDLRRDIKIHQCRSLLNRMPMFKKMDEIELDALCCLLEPVLFTADAYIIHEGDPVEEMLFIKKGSILMSSKKIGGSLMVGSMCGEELLEWAIDPDSSSSSTLPKSTTTLQAITDVEAFRLMPDDLKCIVSQFKNLHQQLTHIFRSNSQHWRLWGARIIQAAWRRSNKRKMERLLKGLRPVRHLIGRRWLDIDIGLRKNKLMNKQPEIHHHLMHLKPE